jgi:hypothetical protein
VIRPVSTLDGTHRVEHGDIHHGLIAEAEQACGRGQVRERGLIPLDDNFRAVGWSVGLHRLRADRDADDRQGGEGLAEREAGFHG